MEIPNGPVEPVVLPPPVSSTSCLPCAEIQKHVDALQKAQDMLAMQCPTAVVNTPAVMPSVSPTNG